MEIDVEHNEETVEKKGKEKVTEDNKIEIALLKRKIKIKKNEDKSSDEDFESTSKQTRSSFYKL